VVAFTRGPEASIGEMANSSQDSNPLRGRFGSRRTESYDEERARLAREAAAAKAALNETDKAARNKRKAGRDAQPSEGDFSPNSACDDVIDDILAYLAPIDLRELGMCNAEWRDFIIGEDASGRLAQRCHQVCPRDEANVAHAIFGLPLEPTFASCFIVSCFVVAWGHSAPTGELRLTTITGHDEMRERSLHWHHPRPCTAVAEVRAALSTIEFDYRPIIEIPSKGHAQEAIRGLSAVFRDTESSAWMPPNAPDAIVDLVYMQHVAVHMKLTGEWRKRCRRMAATLFDRLSVSRLSETVSHLLRDVRKLDALLAGA